MLKLDPPTDDDMSIKKAMSSCLVHGSLGSGESKYIILCEENFQNPAIFNFLNNNNSQ